MKGMRITLEVPLDPVLTNGTLSEATLLQVGDDAFRALIDKARAQGGNAKVEIIEMEASA